MATLKPLDLPSLPWLRSFGRARWRYGAVLVHPDKQRLVAADHDGTVTIWQLADARELMRLPAVLSSRELDDARSVQLLLHPDGVRLFVTVVIIDTSDVTLCWDLERGNLIDRFEYPRVPGAFIDDRLAVSAHGLHLTLWDLETGKTIRDHQRTDSSWRLYGTIGMHALAGGRRGVELWHLREGRVRWYAMFAEARGAAVVGDAALLVAPGRCVLRTIDGAVLRELACPALATDSADPAGEQSWVVRVDRAATTAVIAGATPDLLAIDLTTGALRSRFTASRYVQFEIAATDRDAIVWDLDGTSAVWSLATGESLLRARGEITLTQDGETAIVQAGAHLRAWPVDRRDLTTVAAPAWFAIAAAASDIVVGVDHANVVHVVHGVCGVRGVHGVHGVHGDHGVERSGAVRTTWLAPHVRALVLEGRRIAHADSDAVTILDVLTGERTTIPVVADSIAMAPDGSALAIVDRLGEVTVHVADTPHLAQRFTTRDKTPELLAIEPGGRRLAIRADTSIELWRRDPPLRLHTFRSITRPSCATFDASRRWLVSGHEDGAVLIRDTLARAHHATLETQSCMIRRIALRGMVAAVIGSDGAVSLWNIEDGMRLDTWRSEIDILDVAWLDDDTLACASECGLVLLRFAR